MAATLPLVHYHAPNTRSFATRWLFEELGNPPHELRVLNFKKEEHKSAAYLAINPMGKVPTFVHGNTVVTEAAAIAMYLADLFPEKGLAPAIGDTARGTYQVDRVQPSGGRACNRRSRAETRARSYRYASLRNLCRND